MVELYKQERGAKPVLVLPLVKNESDQTWSISVPASDLQRLGLLGQDPSRLDKFIYYGFRAWGPNWPQGTNVGVDVDENGNRFNPNKLLLDPYGQRVSHDPVTPDFRDVTIYATGDEHREKDSGEQAPKSVVLNEPRPLRVAAPKRDLKDEVIYELQVRGFTKLARGVAAPGMTREDRGTFKGLQRMIPYLKTLGITAVELMPIHEFPDGLNGSTPTKETNAWGYNTLSFFSPNSRFVTDKSRAEIDGEREEFQQMAEALHEAGIKVIMDVVFNHTAEMGAGGEGGRDSTIHSLRGLDNANYYQTLPDRRFFENHNGVGANLNAAHPVVRDLVIDSLKYWVSLGVDGFRFDLASVLLNAKQSGEAGFFFDKMDVHNIANRAARELPGVYLIAEPWATKDDSYKVGEFPRGWAEWNDQYRDVIRETEANKSGRNMIVPGEVARRVAGSQDLYDLGFDGRKPYHSINIITVHDGFTLRDLVSYNGKRNDQSPPYGPSEGGTDNNHSWDHHVEGDTPEQTEARRRQAQRNLLALPLLSYGTPLLLAGDELSRTQRGNNNMYNVDNRASWVHWPKDVYGHPIFRVVKNLLAFRHAHETLRPGEWANGEDNDGNGLRDLAWFQANGDSAEDRDLPPEKRGYMNDSNAGFLGWRLDAEEKGEAEGVRSIYIAYNWSPSNKALRLPPPAEGKHWYWVGDTSSSQEARGNFVEPGQEKALNEVFAPRDAIDYEMSGGSVLVLVEK